MTVPPFGAGIVIYVLIGLFIGLACWCVDAFENKGLSSDGQFAAIFTSMFLWPGFVICLFVIAVHKFLRGVGEVWRHYFPKKVRLPKARAVR
jgi:hypothetical protein